VLTTVSNVSKTIQSALRVRFELSDLLEMCGVCPEIFRLQWVTKTEPGVEDYQTHPVVENQTPPPTVLLLQFPKITKAKRMSKYKNALKELGDEQRPTPIEIPLNLSIQSVDPKESFKEPVSPVGTAEILAYLKKDASFYKDQIVHVHKTPAKEARFGTIAEEVHPVLVKSLHQLGVSRYYAHQAKGINALMAGDHVIISTGTSSGKSLVYNLPILQTLMSEPSASALYLFPTKALAHDQFNALQKLVETIRSEGSTDGSECRMFEPGTLQTLDGDTGHSVRRHVIDRARIVLTNPDILHFTVLPQHHRYMRLLKNCRYIVIDEAHSYSGAFGCHVSCVIRRLLRVCMLYDSFPQFICCSATIGNPKEHFEALVPVHIAYREGKGSKKLCVITGSDDGSPQGERQFVFWNPPYADVGLDKKPSAEKSKLTRKLPGNYPNMSPREKRDTRLRLLREMPERRSSIYETARLMTMLVRARVRTLSFVKVRKLTELVTKYCKELLSGSSTPQLVNQICSYRAGYMPEKRRNLEHKIFNEEILGIAATNALELGINIGSLDAVLLLGFPGSVSSLWQQSGRAGRSNRAAIIFFVAFDSPIDQFFMKHPDKLISRPVENAIVEANNAYVLKNHLLCAIKEVAMLENSVDFKLFGEENSKRVLGELLTSRSISRTVLPRTEAGAWIIHPSIDQPQKAVNLRSIDNQTITVIHAESNEKLDKIEFFRAFFEVHPGACYLNQARQFIIQNLDLQHSLAIACPSNVKYYTSVRDHTDVDVNDKIRTLIGPSHAAYYGRVSVSTSVYGYRKHWFSNGEIFETVPLTLPPIQYSTFGVWIDLPPSIVNEVEKLGHDFLGSLHGANHALLHSIPLWVSSDRTDCGTECPSVYQERARPLRLVLFDRCPGGIGISRKIGKCLLQLVQSAYRIVSGCDCDFGCPSCVCDTRCPELNDILDKAGAIKLLSIVVDLL
jgi:DEAD/DEAH box helicase domain-containing protein